MALIGWALLLFFAVLSALAITSKAHGDSHLTLRCHPDQAASLLQLKKSLFFRYPNPLESWQDGTNCCLWEGVGCSHSSGRVRALELSGHDLYSPGLDPAIFNLTSLQLLDLSMNNFGEYSLPASGFERLSLLTHLNLSNSGFTGQIPISIGRLANLISLDLSSHYSVYGGDTSIGDVTNGLWLHQPNFHSLVANLKNLRELYLDFVDMSRSRDWCHTLAKFLPDLRVLSLSHCYLVGPICPSLSKIHSLTVINLEKNYMPAAPFPEFFMDFLNLSVLQLAGTNLQGWFPRTTFQSKTLRVLDLSGNQDLSGHVPNLSNTSSIEIMMLGGTNFSCAKPGSFSNFKSVKTLSLDVNFVSVEPQSSLGILSSLRHLELSHIDSAGDLGPILSWIGDLQNLLSLKLYMGNFSRTSFSSVSKLKSLRSLEIFNCIFSGPIPSAIGNLTNLKSLKINGCNFLGSIPSSVGNLRNLRNLEINGYTEDYDTLAGSPKPIPAAIGNLSNLESLHINYCAFSGPIPDDFGLLKKLTVLQIRQCSLSGSIPNSIVNLTHLIDLDLSSNLLNGKIPTSVFTLPILEHLDLFRNELSGHIQEFDVASSCLVDLRLGMNELTGVVPRSFLKMRSLESLNIRSNNFVGSVDLDSFWRLPNLSGLILSNNKLSVTDRAENNSSSMHPSRLVTLGLACCRLTNFPSILTHTSDLLYLDLSCNRISGDIPNWIWERWSSNLVYLDLSDNMFTGMGLISSVLPSTTMEVLDLSSNRLQGQIPMPNSSAIFLDYSHNSFSFIHPNFTLYLSNTKYLRMSHNTISGHIPYSVCNSTLSVLDLSYNNFSGLVPSCLISNAGLGVLNLRENHFQGTLPSNITDRCALQTIDLHGNNIQGQLPSALCNCSVLEVLDLGKNKIVDTFPSWLRRLSHLRVLVLRSNQFYGSINGLVGDQKSRDYFSSLQIVDLSSNNFSGNLRSEWFGQLKSMRAKLNSTGETLYAQNLSSIVDLYQDSTEITYKGSSVAFERILTTLTAIDFSNNRLEGSIPESVGQLVSLHVLNMSHNAFTGRIPAQLGIMAALESLDLSFNQLSGKIPQELTNLTFLSILKLSENQLVGKIPQSRQFSTFESSSFEGNLGLCGPPLSMPCAVSPAPPSPGHEDDSSHVDVVLFLFVGLGFGIGFAAAILMRWGRIGAWFVKSARSLQT